MTALCHGPDIDPDTWFPDTKVLGTHRRKAVTAKAKIVCGQCPIRQECLQHVLDNDIRHGIWGGLTSAQRYRIRRSGKKAA